MRSYTRHQLKQDAFATSTAETISWAVENRSILMAVGAVVLVILAAVAGGWAYINHQDQQARQQLSLAIQKFNQPIRPAGTPPTPEVATWASAQERGKATNGEFVRIADQYRHTQSGQVARYFAGITAREMGDNAASAKNLEEVAAGRYPEIASLARFALASVYHDTGKNSQAVDLYKQLIDHPTISIGKSTAQFALASLYEVTGRPDEAKHLYEQMQKENPAGMVAQMAGQRLQEMGKQ